MAVLRLDRFTTGPAGAGEMLARHAALVVAVKDAHLGLLDGQLAQAGDRTWTGVRRWDCLASGQAAVAGAPAIPRPRRRSRSSKASPWNTPWPSMRDRAQPVHGKDAAVPSGRRDTRRRAWPAPPPPRLRHGPGRALAARRGAEWP
jgi:hypothetical protein